MELTIDVSSEKLFETLGLFLEKEAEKIKNIILNGTNASLDLFDIVNNNDKTCNISTIKNTCGIYVFMMINNTPVNNFNYVNYGAKTNNNLNGSNFSVNKCFYLGKSENSLVKRLNEHLIDSPSTTYSLKLDDINRQHVRGNISLYTFVLRNVYLNYKKIILSVVESFLHDSLTPMVGTIRI